MAVDYTPWVDGVTQFKAAQMNAPLEELKDSANDADDALQDNIDGKADISHSHVVNDITDFPTDIGTGDMLSSNNLSELTSPSDARDNLGLGSAAVADIGTGSSDVAAGDHGHADVGGFALMFEKTQKPGDAAEYPFALPYAMTVPVDCTGSVYRQIGANPTAQVVVSFKNASDTEFATLTVDTSGNATWDGTEETLSAGKVVFPSQDTTWAGFCIMLKGARSIS